MLSTLVLTTTESLSVSVIDPLGLTTESGLKQSSQVKVMSLLYIVGRPSVAGSNSSLNLVNLDNGL
jgi:hypothetical protein